MLSDHDRARLRNLIAAYSGLSPASLGDEALEQAVAQRLAVHGLEGLDAYWPLLQQDGELNRLAQHLTNKETYFFREERHFRLLRERVLPDLLAGRRTLRLWSAGCATGEEAYSLAITLLEAQAQYGPFAFTIIGTDLDAAAVDRARRACYGPRSLRRVPEPLREKYFRAKGPDFCPIPPVKDAVRFAVHNLLGDDLPPDLTGMDIIFCRNVTIYFDEAARDRLNARLAAALREGGYLFVASAETMGHNRGRLALVPLDDAFVFRKGPTAPRPRRAEPPPRPRLPPPPLRPAPAGRQGAGGAFDPTPPLDRARRAFQREDYDAVLRELDRLPPDPSARQEADLLRAATLLQQTRLEEAEAACRRALDREPWQAEAHLLLGLIRRQQGQAEAAVQSLKQAIYLQPTHHHPHFFLAETYRDLGAVREARREYENTLNILRRRPAQPPTRNLVGLDDEMLHRACLLNLERLGNWPPPAPLGRSRT
ncbi:MAG TPA: hypothetical protein ENJ31_02525 [Anaerolineae bacterium]|nr:hypothetical protein [Anaerolineae bacterium]